MGDPLISEMVVNRQRREQLQAELEELYIDRERLIHEANTRHVPESVYQEAVGRCYTEIESAYVRQARARRDATPVTPSS